MTGREKALAEGAAGPLILSCVTSDDLFAAHLTKALARPQVVLQRVPAEAILPPQPKQILMMDAPAWTGLNPAQRQHAAAWGARLVVTHRVDLVPMVTLLAADSGLRHLAGDFLASPAGKGPAATPAIAAPGLYAMLEGVRSGLGRLPDHEPPPKAIQRAIASVKDFDDCLHQLTADAGAINCFAGFVENITTAAYELIDNALHYGAPPGGGSRQISVSYAQRDGAFWFTVADNGGGLKRQDFCQSLIRCVAENRDPKRRPGHGAGLGLFMVLGAAVRVDVEVIPKKFTRVTCILPLDKRLKDFDARSKSLHFFLAD